MCGKTRQDRIWNDNNRERVGVAPVVENLEMTQVFKSDQRRLSVEL